MKYFEMIKLVLQFDNDSKHNAGVEVPIYIPIFEL